MCETRNWRSNMKKSISLLFCLVMLLSVMTGCGRSAENDVRPGDTETNRPGVNDNVDTGNDGIIGNNENPAVSNRPVTDDIENGIDNAGDAVQRGMDNVGDAVENATDRMTGNR